MKIKGERERYCQLKADFQRTAWRGLLQGTVYKLKENSRKGKTRNLFRKTGVIKGTFCPKMGTIKDINSGDLVMVKRSRRHGKNTQKNCTKKILMN